MKIELKKVPDGRTKGQSYLLIDGKHQIQIVYIYLHGYGLTYTFFTWNGDKNKQIIVDSIQEALLFIGVPFNLIDEYIKLLPKGCWE